MARPDLASFWSGTVIEGRYYSNSDSLSHWYSVYSLLMQSPWLWWDSTLDLAKSQCEIFRAAWYTCKTRHAIGLCVIVDWGVVTFLATTIFQRCGRWHWFSVVGADFAGGLPNLQPQIFTDSPIKFGAGGGEHPFQRWMRSCNLQVLSLGNNNAALSQCPHHVRTQLMHRPHLGTK